jgi:hypothetical protein
MLKEFLMASLFSDTSKMIPDAQVPMTLPTDYIDPPFHPNLLDAKIFAGYVIDISAISINLPRALKFAVCLSNFPSARAL